MTESPEDTPSKPDTSLDHVKGLKAPKLKGAYYGNPVDKKKGPYVKLENTGAEKELDVDQEEVTD